MTWKTDRQAFRNVGRAMRRQDVADFIKSNAPKGTSIIPTVAGDKLIDLVSHFRNGYGVLMHSRSENTVDVIIVRPDSVENVHPDLVGDTTVGEVVDEMDKLDSKAPIGKLTTRMQFTLAA